MPYMSARRPLKYPATQGLNDRGASCLQLCFEQYQDKGQSLNATYNVLNEKHDVLQVCNLQPHGSAGLKIASYSTHMHPVYIAPCAPSTCHSTVLIHLL